MPDWPEEGQQVERGRQMNSDRQISTADEIREHCIKEHVEPARTRRAYTVTLRSGDVHEELGYVARLPAVCAALGSDTFERVARVRRLAIDGPLNGASTLFVFVLR